MKLVATSVVASLHKSHEVLKHLAPIDCLLGETVCRIRADGTRFYSEFIAAQPPTTLFQIYGPNDEWVIYGTEIVQAEINSTFTQVIGKNRRPRYLKFRDGPIYEMCVPTLVIDGLLTKTRVVNKMDICTIRCGSLVTQVAFSYQLESSLSKLKNSLKFWESEKSKPVSDNVEIAILKVVNKEDPSDLGDACLMSQGSGSWLSHL